MTMERIRLFAMVTEDNRHWIVAAVSPDDAAAILLECTYLKAKANTVYERVAEVPTREEWRQMQARAEEAESKYRALRYTIDEALNSGDGTYRP